MTERDNTNRGALFGNTHKREGKKDPDLQGKIDINGTEFWLSGWFFFYDKDGEKKRAIGLAIGDEVQQQQPKQDPNKKAREIYEDADIPF